MASSTEEPSRTLSQLQRQSVPQLILFARCGSANLNEPANRENRDATMSIYARIREAYEACTVAASLRNVEARQKLTRMEHARRCRQPSEGTHVAGRVRRPYAGSINGVGVRFQAFRINDLEMVDQNGVSWNRVTSWLRVVDALRRVA
jgi:hypothetical protein